MSQQVIVQHKTQWADLNFFLSESAELLVLYKMLVSEIQDATTTGYRLT
jgi:hypothetical protein